MRFKQKSVLAGAEVCFHHINDGALFIIVGPNTIPSNRVRNP